MPKFRPQTIQHFHGVLADAAATWDESGHPSGLRHYVLAHGATHLRAIEDHERLWELLRDEDYRAAQLEAFSQYEPAYRALKAGIDLYVERNGQAPEDDSRLCWLALRAGELSNEAKTNIDEAFEWVRERPLEDVSRIEEAIERLSVLDEVEFYKAALLALWIEVDRQAELPEAERAEAGSRLVLEAVEARIPKGPGTVDWSECLSEDFMAWLALHFLSVLPKVKFAELLMRTSDMPTFADALIQSITDTVIPRVKDQHLKFILIVVEKFDSSSKTKILPRIAHALSITESLIEEERLLEYVLEAATDIWSDSEKSRALSGIVDAVTQASSLVDREALILRALEVARSMKYDNSWLLARLAQALAQIGNWTHALEVAHSIKGDYPKAKSLLAIAPVLEHVGHLKQARNSLANAYTLVNDFPDSYALIDSLVGVAQTLHHIGEEEQAESIFTQALENAIAIDHAWNKFLSLMHIAQALTHAGKVERARSVFAIALDTAITVQVDYRGSVRKEITYNADRAKAFTHFAQTLAQAEALANREELFWHTLVTVDSLENDSEKVEALLGLLEAVSQDIALTNQDSLFEHALRIADSIKSDSKKSKILRSVAQSVARSQRLADQEHLFEHLLNSASTLKSDTEKPNVLSGIAQALAKARWFDRALETADAINSASIRAATFSCIAQTLAQDDQFSRALGVAAVIRKDAEKSRVFSTIARTLTSAGEVNKAYRILYQSLMTAELLSYGAEKDKLLFRIAEAMMQSNQFDKARRAANAITHDYYQSTAFAQLSSALAWAGHFYKALRTALDIRKEEDKSEALVGIAQAFAKDETLADREKVLFEILVAADSIDSHSIYFGVLSQITAILSQAGRFEESLQVALAVKDDAGTGDAPVSIAEMISHALTQANLESFIARIPTTTSVVGSDTEELKAPTGRAQAIYFEETLNAAAGVTTKDTSKIEAISSINRRLASANMPEPFEIFAQSVRLPDHVWHEVLRRWRTALINHVPAPLTWLRRSLCHHPFSFETAYDGVSALQAAKLRASDRKAFDAIIRQCPQLGLNFLLEEH